MNTQTEMECWASILILTFGTTWTAELSATRAVFTLPPRKILGTNLCQRASGPKSYRMQKEGIGSLEDFQGPYRKSNPEPPVVLRYVVQYFFWNLLHYNSVLCLNSPVAIPIFILGVKILPLILV